jgi:hypothetical protein
MSSAQGGLRLREHNFAVRRREGHEQSRHRTVRNIQCSLKSEEGEVFLDADGIGMLRRERTKLTA